MGFSSNQGLFLLGPAGRSRRGYSYHEYDNPDRRHGVLVQEKNFNNPHSSHLISNNINIDQIIMLITFSLVKKMEVMRWWRC